MNSNQCIESRLGLSVPNEWWPAQPLLKEVAASGFGWVQLPSPPAAVLADSRSCIRHARAALAARESTALRTVLCISPSVDKRYRPSLASDLMEPARVCADEFALALIESHQFERGEVFETRQGVCRLGSGMCRRLAAASPALRESVGPHAEWLARKLLADEAHPTPLTRRRHRIAVKQASR